MRSPFKIWISLFLKREQNERHLKEFKCAHNRLSDWAWIPQINGNCCMKSYRQYNYCCNCKYSSPVTCLCQLSYNCTHSWPVTLGLIMNEIAGPCRQNFASSTRNIFELLDLTLLLWMAFRRKLKYILSKRREPLTQWSLITSQKPGVLSCTL